MSLPVLQVCVLSKTGKSKSENGIANLFLSDSSIHRGAGTNLSSATGTFETFCLYFFKIPQDGQLGVLKMFNVCKLKFEFYL